MNIKIRNEHPEDYRIVEEVAKEAFWNLYFPVCNEHVVIHNMRNHPDFIPELSLWIEVDDKIVGSIFYTHSKVVSKDGTQRKTITFGPVSILPSMHRKWLGRKLITHSIETAKKLGYKAILTLGYLYHYELYGFVGAKRYGISIPDGKYYKRLLVLPLYEDALDNISGHVIFADVFDHSEDEVDEFDKSFFYNKKQVQDSQKEYEIASTMLDE